ncbi:hypothetical protein T03_5971 [Trichinella britovi]|uniref:Uncharacterized protein n=1 Tax=Trichinella britovi TaxID=45882 RepID=A0A0V1C494_TRIBR|nr:hypothetical protein T03_5971 [Trichinella britovi]
MGRARRMTTPIHHTTCYPTLTSLFLPPVDLQKGERDTQVQFRGRCHTSYAPSRCPQSPECLRRLKPKTIRGAEDQRASKKFFRRPSRITQNKLSTDQECYSRPLQRPDLRSPPPTKITDVNEIEEQVLVTEELYRASGALQAELEQDLEGEERQCATDDWARRRWLFRN